MNDFHMTIILSNIIVSACPVIFAALGETLTEKSGVINLSLDGTILLSAMAAFAVAYTTHSVFLGFMTAALVGAATTLIVVCLNLYLHLSQVAVGFALTLTCRDLAYFIGNPYSRIHGPQVSPFALPFLTDIPFLGPVFFSHNIIVYMSMILIFFVWYYMEKTPMGLTLKSVGEHPQAAFTRGINPGLVRIIYGFIGGCFVGLAGASFSLLIKAGWGRPQGCEGIGWIALALVIFGGWRPLRVAAGCYLFSFLQVMGIYFQKWFPTIPSQVFQVAPFPLMIFSLILINVLQKDSVIIWASKKPKLKSLFSRLAQTAPANLGKSIVRP